MSVIIAIVNQKGGVGKTTTAVNLGAYLAELGQRVLLVDLDPQANATSGLGIDYRALSGGIYEALAGSHGLLEIVHSTAHTNYRVAPATPSLAGANVELVDAERREYLLSEALVAARDEFDVVLIDCPPSLGLLTINGLVAADSVLIPVQAEYYALEGLGQLLETIDLIRENIKPELAILGAVITMFDRRIKLSDQILQELYRYFPNKIFRAVIPRNVRLTEAPSHGLSVQKYDPASKGATAYERLAREILASLAGADEGVTL